MTLSREELFTLIWTIPALQIGKLLGSSGNAVVNACKRRGIPVPGRGHWAKVRYGQSPERPELPESTQTYAPIKVPDGVVAALQDLLASASSPAAPGVRPTEQRADLIDGVDAQAEALDQPSSNTPEPSPSASMRTVLPTASPGVGNGARAKIAETADEHRSFRPTLASLLHMARQLEERRLVRQLIAEVARARESERPAASALLTLWIERAERELQRLDPVDSVVQSSSDASEESEGRARWWEAGTNLNDSGMHRSARPRQA